MTFLPKGYETPKNVGGGSYMKLVDGANKFRVLSPAITGYTFWVTEDGKDRGIRVREYPKSLPANIRRDEKIKHFWAFVVWNYADEAVEILEITQASIRDGIHEYYKMGEYGEPTEYDLIINKKGEKLLTEYSVQALPPKPKAGNITAAYESKKINLNALFDGGNPFEDAPTAEIEDVFDAGGAVEIGGDLEFEDEAPVTPERPKFMKQR